MNSLAEEKVLCYHCHSVCDEEVIDLDEKAFCCMGCKTVYEILQDNGLCTYYDLNENAGVSLKAANFAGKYEFLSDPLIEKQLLDFKNDSLARVTFFIPSVHCSSCVWLLENFNKAKAGVFNSRLNFLQKKLFVSYDPSRVSLKELVELLATLGYAPLFNQESTVKSPKSANKEQHRLLLRIGVTGFCFGNIMLLSFPEYFRLDLANNIDAGYQKFFLYLNFLLALPVFFFGASDYLKGAWVSLKENWKGSTRVLSVDIPIAMGISALFIRSTYETLFNQTSGYWDSLAGLVLFLLAGKWLQQITYNYLSFEHDYKSYFPLAVRVKEQGFRNVEELKPSDLIEIHHQELIPADSILLSEQALIDYSFVTGESAPAEAKAGDLVFAGGRQLGTRIELRVEKQVSKSYLTELWNNEAFRKEKISRTSGFANFFSRYFTYAAIGLAALTGLYWHFQSPELMWVTVTAVLMVACPCALTLAMPFAMNSAMIVLGKNRFFVKNQNVIQLLTEVDTIAFDKTGTLTEGKSGIVKFIGGELSEEEKTQVLAVTSQSLHPLSKLITEHLRKNTPFTPGSPVNEMHKNVSIGSSLSEAAGMVTHFQEIKGEGLEAVVDGLTIRLGNTVFLGISDIPKETGQVAVEINGEYRGRFSVSSKFRDGWETVLKKMSPDYLLALISGDNNRDMEKVAPYFREGNIHFGLKPQEKLDFVKNNQLSGRKILMIGDGLNDAGALRQAHVGVALSEDVNAFSPACDVILDAREFNRINEFIGFSRIAMNVVIAAFALSVLYNIVGLGLAVTGHLSPLYAAVFMPLSSMSVVLFAVGCTWLFAKLKKLI